MRISMIAILVLGLAVEVSSQTSEPLGKSYTITKDGRILDANGKPPVYSSIPLPNNPFQDTSLQKLKDFLQKRKLPDNGMPNAINITPLPDVYIGNNGKGQDIYRAQLDNMPILKPDSSFYSAMPSSIPGSKAYGLLKSENERGYKWVPTIPKKNSPKKF